MKINFRIKEDSICYDGIIPPENQISKKISIKVIIYRYC